MQCRIRDFRCKEVINVCDGCRLGYVSDLEVIVPEGKVSAIIVYGPGRLTLAHKADEFVSIEEMKTSAKIMALSAVELLGLAE